MKDNITVIWGTITFLILSTIFLYFYHKEIVTYQMDVTCDTAHCLTYPTPKVDTSELKTINEIRLQ